MALIKTQWRWCQFLVEFHDFKMTKHWAVRRWRKRWKTDKWWILKFWWNYLRRQFIIKARRIWASFSSVLTKTDGLSGHQRLQRVCVCEAKSVDESKWQADSLKVVWPTRVCLAGLSKSIFDLKMFTLVILSNVLRLRCFCFWCCWAVRAPEFIACKDLKDKRNSLTHAVAGARWNYIIFQYKPIDKSKNSVFNVGFFTLILLCSGPRSRKHKRKNKKPDEKRPRTAFTNEQLARLKQEFHNNQ